MALLKRKTCFWRSAAALMPLAACIVSATAGATAPIASEYSVKAAYLSKFAPFVDWPPATMPAGAPLQICLVGPDPFGGAIDQAMAGQSVGDHKIQLLRLARVDAQTSCQILYVRGSRAQSVAEALAAVRGRPVLTVTDGADPGATRGMLHFVLTNNRVRFEVDPAAAAAGGVMVSSKLLSLGIVRPKG